MNSMFILVVFMFIVGVILNGYFYVRNMIYGPMKMKSDLLKIKAKAFEDGKSFSEDKPLFKDPLFVLTGYKYGDGLKEEKEVVKENKEKEVNPKPTFGHEPRTLDIGS